MNIDASQSDSNSTSPSLIYKAQQDDSEAWQRLADLYGPVVYSWARRSNLQPHDAADVTQEVFQSLTKGLKRFEKRQETDSFRGWLWTITRNKVRDHIRRRAGKEDAGGGTAAYLALQEVESGPPSIDSECGQSELTGVRERALNQIKKRTSAKIWTAFYRTAVLDNSPNDVAEDLGMTVWAVYKARSRVLKRLRDEFEALM